MPYRSRDCSRTPRWSWLSVLVIAALAFGCGDGQQTSGESGGSSTSDSASATAATSEPGAIAIRITYALGTIDINRDGSAMPADLGAQVFAEDSIVTGADGECELQLGDTATVYIEPDSVVAVADLLGTVELDVNEGGIIARVETLAGLREFSVRSPTVVAGVRGTEFRVGFGALSRATEIVVREGTVAALPRDLARDALIAETGLDEERASIIVEQLYASAAVIAAGEELVVDEQAGDSLIAGAFELLQLVQDAVDATDEEFQTQLEAIVSEVETAVAPMLISVPTSTEQKQKFERYDTRAERASAGGAPTAQAPPVRAAPELECPYQEAMAFTVNKRVATMYYPWFATPEVDGGWNEWDNGGRHPPETWRSRFKPLLGLYSSRDPFVMEQHMQWIRRAGIGTLIVAWFGPNSNDDVIRLLLDVAARYQISVALRIEGDVPSNPSLLPTTISFLMREFAPHSAYLRLTAESPYVAGRAERPLVFVFDVGDRFPQWASAMEKVRSESEFPFVLVSGWTTDSVTLGRLDGIAYGSFSEPERSMYEPIRLLPPGAIYIPSITPGFASVDDYSAFTDRRDGALMAEQLGWATTQGATPAMVVITGFNRWPDGTQIEPAVQEAGGDLLDYGSIGSHGYLDKTREIGDKFAPLAAVERTRIRIMVSSSSDWATLRLGRVDWGRAEILAVSEGATESGIVIDAGEFCVNQTLAAAQEGSVISGEIAIDVPVSPTIELGLNKGHQGSTTVIVVAPDGLTLAEHTWQGPPPRAGGYEWMSVDLP